MKNKSWMIIGFAGLLSACSLSTRIGMKFLYRPAQLPSEQVMLDQCYNTDGCNSEDDKLDLYLPKGREWPTIIFIHGGGWTEGDKQFQVAGRDVYGNIGRFYASHGIGVANINYRLQPAVNWQDQLADVRRATEWVEKNISKFGGNPHNIFLMGHSAGGYFAAFVAATADDALRPPLRGVIVVSGAGLDMADEETYRLGADPHYYEIRFRTDDTPDWKQKSSPANFVTSNAPPFLLLYAGGETPPIQHQAKHFMEILNQKHVPAELWEEPGQSHARIVLTLSREDRLSSEKILKFVEKKSLL